MVEDHVDGGRRCRAHQGSCTTDGPRRGEKEVGVDHCSGPKTAKTTVDELRHATILFPIYQVHIVSNAPLEIQATCKIKIDRPSSQ